MSAVLEFLRQYWFELAAGVGFVIELVFIFVKRKPKSVDEFLYALSEGVSLVPDLISKVERSGEGAAKKLEVLNAVCAYVQKYMCRKLTDYELDVIDGVVSEQIEKVLSTPKKKESLNEK